MSNKIRVLHYIDKFPVLSETFVRDLILSLDQSCENIIVTKAVIPGVSINGFCVKSVNSRVLKYYNAIVTRMNDLFGLNANIIVSEKWESYISEFEPDIIHAHFGWTIIELNSMLKSLKLDIPVLVSLHGTDTLRMPIISSYYKNKISTFRQEYRVEFTVPSVYLQKTAEKNFDGLSPTVIANSFNNDFITLNEERLGRSSNVFRIINVGRYISFKGQQYLIEGFSDFIKMNSVPSELLLVGFGPDKDMLQKIAYESGVGDCVKFIDALPHADLPDLLRSCDLYIQPSVTCEKNNTAESFGVVILEAIAVGLPVIVTGSGGMPEVVLSGNGYLAQVIPEKSSTAIANAIKNSYLSEEKMYGSKYREKILRTFSRENNRDNILSNYKHLLDR